MINLSEYGFDELESVDYEDLAGVIPRADASQ